MQIVPAPKGDFVANIKQADITPTNPPDQEKYEFGPPTATPKYNQNELKQLGYVGYYFKKASKHAQTQEQD